MLKKVVKDENEITGYRIDKNNKPLFTEFKQYKSILKIYQTFDKADYVEGNLDLCDNISEILTRLKSVEERKIALMNYGIEKEIAQALSKASGFTEYHSLSKKAMDLVMGDLWATDKIKCRFFMMLG